MMFSKCWSENNADSKIVVLSSENQFRSFRSGGRVALLLFRRKRPSPVAISNHISWFLRQVSHSINMKLIPTQALHTLNYKRLFLIH